MTKNLSPRRELLETALQASIAAGDAVMQIYGTSFEISLKQDRSPITEADRQSHEILAARLAGGIPLLSEEGAHIPYSQRSAWRLFWLVDPLDGTKEFIKRNGEFTVNVALIEAGIPVAGIVYLPAKRELYFGEQSLGSYRVAGGALDRIRSLASALESGSALSGRPAGQPRRIRIVQSISHATDEETDFVSRLTAETGKMEVLSAGSSLKFCRVAEGNADIYPRFGPTMEWDTGAGQCIAECAGCIVLDVDGLSSIRYNRSELRNRSFIVIGRRIKEDPHLYAAVLDCWGHPVVRV